jgi:hypothetical protein
MASGKKDTLILPEPVDLILLVKCGDDVKPVEECVVCNYSSYNTASNKLQCSKGKL